MAPPGSTLPDDVPGAAASCAVSAPEGRPDALRPCLGRRNMADGVALRRTNGSVAVVAADGEAGRRRGAGGPIDADRGERGGGLDVVLVARGVVGGGEGLQAAGQARGLAFWWRYGRPHCGPGSDARHAARRGEADEGVGMGGVGAALGSGVRALLAAHPLWAIAAIIFVEELGVPRPVPSDLLMLLAGVGVRAGTYPALARAPAPGGGDPPRHHRALPVHPARGAGGGRALRLAGHPARAAAPGPADRHPDRGGGLRHAVPGAPPGRGGRRPPLHRGL